MSVVLELSPAEEETLSREAAARRMNVTDYIREKVFSPPALPSPDGNLDPDGQTYSISRALSALEELGKPEYVITEDEWAAFMQGIDESRPGQRSIFESGINPPAKTEKQA